MPKYILKFNGLEGTEDEISRKMGVQVKTLRAMIYASHSSVDEIKIGIAVPYKKKKEELSEPHLLTCRECGCEFKSYRKRSICSSGCRKKRAIRKATKYMAEKKENAPLVIKSFNCLNCGKEVSGQVLKRRKICSHACGDAFMWKQKWGRIGEKVRHGLAMKISRLLRNRGKSNSIGAFKYVGLNGMDLYARLTSIMNSDMTIENYGHKGWHVDHVIPRSLFDMANEEHVYLCFNWRNLRPMWGDENMRRGNKVSKSDIDFVGEEFINEVSRLGIKVDVIDQL